MAKQNESVVSLNLDEATPIGRNLESWLVNGLLFLCIDTRKTGPQTKGSQEVGKAPNMMVGTSSTYVPVAGGRLMTHFIKPMEVQAVRRARATRELDEEDAAAPAVSKSELAALAAADPALAAVLRKAGRI